MKKLFFIAVVATIFACNNTLSMEYTSGLEKEKAETIIKPYILVTVNNNSNNKIRIEHKGTLIVELDPKQSKNIGQKLYFTKLGAHIFTNKIQIKNALDNGNKTEFNTIMNTKTKITEYDLTTYITQSNFRKSQTSTLESGSMYGLVINVTNFPHPNEHKIKVTVKYELEKKGAEQVEEEKE